MQSAHLLPKLVLAAASIVSTIGVADAAYPYRVVVLLPFTPYQGSGVATAINNHGLICGTQIPHGAFCYFRGVITTLQPLPGHAHAYAQGVNDLGQIVGVSYTSDVDGPRRAVIFINGVAQELAATSHLRSEALGINNLGQVAGRMWPVSTSESHAYVSWFGAVRDLGTLGGLRRIEGANGINDRGQIVGVASQPGTPAERGSKVPFIYDKGRMRALPTGGNEGQAASINLHGQVVGAVFDPVLGQNRPVLWNNGKMKVLLDEPGTARDINILGQVVGGIYSRPGGFLYHPSTGARNLNELIDPASGYTIQYPQAINDRRQIVGFGCKELLCGPILLEPVLPHAGTTR